MKNRGGYLRGPWWRYDNDDETETRRCYVVAWGNIVRQPSETFKDLRSIKFVIKTGRGAGRNEKFLVCTSYGESLNTVIMAAMERDDIVFCAGTWVERLKSKTKKGVKPTYEMRVHFIVPLALVEFMLEMYSNPNIGKMIEDYKNEDADVWESD